MYNLELQTILQVSSRELGKELETKFRDKIEAMAIANRETTEIMEIGSMIAKAEGEAIEET